jgi:lysophospholipase L1-like esterase
VIPALIVALLTAAAYLSGTPAVRPPSPVTLGPVRIMPLGDSITFGFRSTDGTGYRGPLDRLLTRPHVWVGSLTDPHGMHHEGHGGWTIDGLAAQARTWTTAAQPGIVLLEAGTNDVRAGDSSATMLTEMCQLVAAVRAGSPRAVIWIALIPDLPAETAAHRAQLRAFNAGLDGLGLRTVDMYAAVGADDLVDGIHPGDGGYIKMAGVWAGALAA